MNSVHGTCGRYLHPLHKHGTPFVAIYTDDVLQNDGYVVTTLRCACDEAILLDVDIAGSYW